MSKYEPIYLPEYTAFISKQKVTSSDWNALFSSLITGHNRQETAIANINTILDGGNIAIEVDSKLSTESENPVQNKVITEEINKINEKISTGGEISTEDIATDEDIDTVLGGSSYLDKLNNQADEIIEQQKSLIGGE